MGGETKIWYTSEVYNDGQWHRVIASRQGARGRLTVDMEEVADRSGDIQGTTIELSDYLFFGGYPQDHTFTGVTNIDFDGCIDNVIIMVTPVDLNLNHKAYGITPGCPVKVNTNTTRVYTVPNYHF